MGIYDNNSILCREDDKKPKKSLNKPNIMHKVINKSSLGIERNLKLV